jgi:hypothetical protein
MKMLAERIGKPGILKEVFSSFGLRKYWEDINRRRKYVKE